MSDPFSSAPIGRLMLRNRFIRAGCYEGLSRNGEVTDELIEHHRRLARGGIAMTTLGYLSISNDGRGFGHELFATSDLLPALKQLTDSVHDYGAAASVQLVHCGFFADPRVTGCPTLGASPKLCLFRMSICREMTEADIAQTVDAFADAAVLAQTSGFDAVEIHAGHGYLLSQFLSPWTNRRKDAFGGSLENRLRFPIRVIESTRKRLPDGFPILVKMNQTDGFDGGLCLEEAIEVARAFEAAGASAIIPSCGFTARTPFMMLRGDVPVREMANNQRDWMMRMGLTLFGRLFVRAYPFSPLFLEEGAAAFRNALSIPVIYIGGVTGIEDANRLLSLGFPFFQIGRATVEQPDFVSRLQQEQTLRSDCDHCNRCIAAMDAAGVRCVTQDERPDRNRPPSENTRIDKSTMA